ncbi:hypothetical protein OYT88_14335 [Sporolactobacillus sp. CQH2019]|uniref:hypothetical protein n=1 Tax=Sporolactobacillus sp. CQH2019 TaxID=3023512 RepID=UPI0023676B90|nr:hypothetical protein [Sporolactobacillus sp. CQH2019]MDD9149729.1 hypothetical protein [Sporolactobacillus sp. CQH2019]
MDLKGSFIGNFPTLLDFYSRRGTVSSGSNNLAACTLPQQLSYKICKGQDNTQRAGRLWPQLHILWISPDDHIKLPVAGQFQTLRLRAGMTRSDRRQTKEAPPIQVHFGGTLCDVIVLIFYLCSFPNALDSSMSTAGRNKETAATYFTQEAAGRLRKRMNILIQNQ